MLRISKMTDYAIMVMVQLHGRYGEVLSAQALAEASRLELPTVSKVLKLLVNTGLVESYRGAAGGYSLLRKASDISVAEIIEAIEGPIAMTECSIEEGLCAQESKCGLRGNWQRISLAISQAMSSVSLAEMAHPEKPINPGSVKAGLLKMKPSGVHPFGVNPTGVNPTGVQQTGAGGPKQPSTLKITTLNSSS